MNRLDAMLERWQRTDIITAAQAEQIRAAEASAADRRIPLVAEVLGYLGLAFILTAGGLLMARLWESLGVGARSGILALVTLLLVLAGWAIRSSTEPALRRLSSFLWLAAVAGAGATADVVASDGLDMNTGFSLPAGVVMTALGLALWLVRKSAPQLVGLFAGVVLLCAGFSDLLKEDAFGMLLFAVGVAGVALARLAALLPQGSAYALSSTAMLFGARWTAFDFLSSGQPWALELGLATGLALLALSVAWRNAVLLGFGTAGVFLFLPQIVEEYLGDTLGSTAALLVAGMALIAVSLLAVRLRHRLSG